MNPIAFSERHPTDEDCDKKGFCWFWFPIRNEIQLESWVGSWDYMNMHSYYLQMTKYTHWLPHWAIKEPKEKNDTCIQAL